VTLKIPAGVQSGRKLHLKGKGMPNPKGVPGDLYVVAQIKVSKSLSQKDKDLFKELGKTFFLTQDRHRLEGALSMTTKKHAIVLTRTFMKGTSGIGVREMALLCGAHPDLIDRFVNLGLVDPVGRDEDSNELRFDEETISTVRKILRLRNQLGINYAGIGVVLDLLSRIERLESWVRELENHRNEKDGGLPPAL
jgi:DNA-binding transcriptional MerR regulator